MRIKAFSHALLTSMVLLLAAPLLAGAGQGPNADIAPIIQSGLDAYKTDGADAAVTAWIKGSAIEGNKDALGQANVLRQVQLYYGKYSGFEVVHTKTISANTKVVYLVIDFEKGPMFAKFSIYKSADGWILTSFTFNTKEEQIFPDSF